MEGSLVATVVAILVEPVAAAGSFSINPYGGFLGGVAEAADGSFGNSGIILPATEQSSFVVGFVLTRDYRPDTPVRIS